MAKGASWRGASVRALLALAGTVAVPSCVGNIGPPDEPPPGAGGASATGSAGAGGPTGSAGRDRHRRRPVARCGAGGSAVTGAGGTDRSCSSATRSRPAGRRCAASRPTSTTTRSAICSATRPTRAARCRAQVDSKQNLFGNDADEQSPSALLVEKYQTVAESVAARATASTTALGKLHSCASNVTAANEEACARTIATSLAPRAYRRTVATSEIDELVALYSSVRALSTTVTFASGVAAMIEAMLQAPEFLYRVELGTRRRRQHAR